MATSTKILVLIIFLSAVAVLATIVGLNIVPPATSDDDAGRAGSVSDGPAAPGPAAPAFVSPAPAAPAATMDTARLENEFQRLNRQVEEGVGALARSADALAEVSRAQTAAARPAADPAMAPGTPARPSGAGGDTRADAPRTAAPGAERVPGILRYPPGDTLPTGEKNPANEAAEVRRGYLRLFVKNYQKQAGFERLRPARADGGNPEEFAWLEGLTLANRLTDPTLVRPFETIDDPITGARVRKGAFHEVFRALRRVYQSEAAGDIGPIAAGAAAAGAQADGFAPLVEKLGAINRRFFTQTPARDPMPVSFRVLDTPETLTNVSATKLSYVFDPAHLRTANHYAIASVYLCLMEQLGYHAAPVRLPDRVLIRVTNPRQPEQYVHVDLRRGGLAPMTTQEYLAHYRLSAEEQQYYLLPELNVAQWIALLLTREAALVAEHSDRESGLALFQEVLGLDEQNRATGTPYDAFNREARYGLARTLLLANMPPLTKTIGIAVEDLATVDAAVRETAIALLEEAVGRRRSTLIGAPEQRPSRDYADANLLWAGLAAAGDGNLAELEDALARVERQDPEAQDAYLFYVRAVARDRAGGEQNYQGARADLARYLRALDERLARLTRDEHAAAGTIKDALRHENETRRRLRREDLQRLRARAEALDAAVRLHRELGLLRLGSADTRRKLGALERLGELLGEKRAQAPGGAAYSDGDLAALMALVGELGDENKAYAWKVQHVLRRLLDEDHGLDQARWTDAVRRLGAS